MFVLICFNRGAVLLKSPKRGQRDRKRDGADAQRPQHHFLSSLSSSLSLSLFLSLSLSLSLSVSLSQYAISLYLTLSVLSFSFFHFLPFLYLPLFLSPPVSSSPHTSVSVSLVSLLWNKVSSCDRSGDSALCVARRLLQLGLKHQRHLPLNLLHNETVNPPRQIVKWRRERDSFLCYKISFTCQQKLSTCKISSILPVHSQFGNTCQPSLFNSTAKRDTPEAV